MATLPLEPRPCEPGSGVAPARAEQPKAVSSSGSVTEIIEQLTAAWRRGECPRAEDLLAQHPELGDEDAVRLVYEEACLRQEAGDALASAEVLRRFPRWRSKLALLLDCQKLLWTLPTPDAEFPEPGEDLGDFRILAELGRGAHGRSFLASQASLADRPLVLKITPMSHDEHLSLARLQHMHIVPLYFEQVLPERNLRVLGMPFLGGAALDQILDALRTVPAAERTGRQVLDTLDRLEATHATAQEYATSGPFRSYLAQASYVQTVCWVAACLADALQYAHDRSLVHLDIKPANVLIAGDGQPMLLDFHLARGPVGPGLDTPDRFGGTPDYLAPEQRAAMTAVSQGKPITVPVDGRSDIYSLGLLLYKALGGNEAIGQVPGRGPLRTCNPRVSPGLSDIIGKCLADNPGDRYPTAAALSQDLRRHLSDLPLRGVLNRSMRERWQKWRRRSPAALGRTLFWIAALAGVVAILEVANLRSRQRPHQIDAALAEARQQLEQRRYHEATLALDRGLALAASLAESDLQKRALNIALQRVLREQAAAELHTLVDLLRFRYGISPPPDDEAVMLYRRGEQVWKRRGLLLTPAPGATPHPRAEQAIRADLLDLAGVLTDLRVHGNADTAPVDAISAAASILHDAERDVGPSPALDRERRAYDELLARSEPTVKTMAGTTASIRAAPVPQTAWEHYDLGRSLLRAAEHARAAQEFRQSVALQPEEFWPHFFEAVCAYHLGQYPGALAALDICVALAPRTAECYFDRAKVHEALGQLDAAQRDYTRALELNPRFSDAALNRGTLAFRGGRFDDAIADLEHARASASGPRSRGLIAYNLALVHAARNNWPVARASLRQAIASGNEAARALAPRFGLQ
jgi:serine/threonine protein kinase/tetratricopeptide (TPR) repeat protein